MVELNRNDLQDAMSRRTDAELLEIVGSCRGDYRSDALMAAELEVKRRGLEGERLVALKEEAAEGRAEARRVALEPLETHWRLFLLVFPYIVALEPYLSLHTAVATGYPTKARQFWIWVGLGFALHIGLLILYELVSTALAS